MKPLFVSYEEWRNAMVNKAGVELSRSYCDERILALSDETLTSTQSFLAMYGKTYLIQVKRWFERASQEAVQ
jgi:hypothetical protein